VLYAGDALASGNAAASAVQQEARRLQESE
jgi:hypothetical protein